VAQVAGEEERRADGLVGVEHLLDAHAMERGLVASQGQLLVRRGAHELHRTPDDHPLGQGRQLGPGIVADLQQEGGEQVLEAVAPAENLGLGEALLGSEALERLDEARLGRVLDIGLDGPRPGGDRPFAGEVGRRVERQARAEGEQLLLGGLELDQMGRPIGAGQGQDGVGGPEVDPETVTSTVHGRASFCRGGTTDRPLPERRATPRCG
jgi:hypothetical protein